MMQAPPPAAQAATEAAPPEQKGTHPQSALHESILSQVKDGVVTHDANGGREISIRLTPEELGELKIQVRMEGSKVHVEVVAENQAVKDVLLSNLDSLKQALSSKSFNMDGFNVSTGGTFSQLPEDKREPRQQPQQRTTRIGGYGEDSEVARVNYLTGGDNTLLDFRA